MLNFSWTLRSILDAGNELKAFTLPEVIITLAIVGILSMLLIRTVVTEHNKKTTVTKLKHTYSVLSQVIELAQFYNGPYSTWDTGKEISPIDYYGRYWQPHFRKSAYCGNAPECGYKGGKPWTNTGGSALGVGLTSSETRLLFSFGNMIAFVPKDPTFSGKTSGNNGKGNTPDIQENYLYVDINGAEAPNILGTDIFMFSIDDNGSVFPFCYSLPKEEVDKLCTEKTKGEVNCCTAKIMNDGWEIKDDYPW